jgi:hypothetical protein
VKLLDWMIKRFLMSGVMFFAAGPVVIPGASEGAAPPVTDSGTGIEGLGGEAEDSSAAEESGELIESGQEADGEAPEGQQAAGKEEKIDWRTVPQDVKAHIQEISKTNPKLGNSLQNAVYTSQTFLREFPGGLKEAQGLKKVVEDIGGLEEVQGIHSSYKDMQAEQEALDSKARSGDVSVIDNLMEIAGDGFSLLMPSALDKWSAKDPAGYGHVIGKVMVNAMQEAGVVADLNLAFKMLALNNPEATKLGVEALQKVAGWVNQVGKIASRAPQKPQVDPAIAQQTKDLENQRAQIFNEKFANEFGSWRDSQIRDLVKTVSGGKVLNEFQATTLGNRVVQEMQSILKSDPEYMKSLEKIYNSRDMASLLKFSKSRTSKLLPDMVKKVYRNLFGSAPVKKTAPPAAKPPVAAQAGAAQQTQEWQKIDAAKAPSPDAIDGTKTDFKMKFNKQAILKDGRKVYWGDRVPS